MLTDECLNNPQKIKEHGGVTLYIQNKKIGDQSLDGIKKYILQQLKVDNIDEILPHVDLLDKDGCVL